MTCEFAGRKVLQNRVVISECGGGHCPYRNCDKHDWEVIEGDWDADIILPGLKRVADQEIGIRKMSIWKAQEFLEVARLARIEGAHRAANLALHHAAEARKRAIVAKRTRAANLAGAKAIEDRIAARNAPATREAA